MCPDIKDRGPRCGVDTEVVDFRRLDRKDEGRSEAGACIALVYVAFCEQIDWKSISVSRSSNRRTSGAEDSLVVHKPDYITVSKYSQLFKCYQSNIIANISGFLPI